MKKIIFMLLVLGITSNAQVKKTLMPIASDCKNAIKLNFGKSKYVSYGPTVAPIGFGQVQEIKGSNKNGCYVFEKEHNSAWYYFDVPQDGQLVLDIIPIDTTNDYDFMIFKVRGLDGSFCDLLDKQPIRSNISRGGKGGVSTTGLSSIGKANLVHVGLGETFSKPLEVKKGERYYLVLDNVYPNGSGHTLKLGFQKTLRVGGIVFNDENQPIQAEVTLTDAQGHKVTTQSDSVGKYIINADLWESFSYSISFFNSSYFVNSQTISDDSLVKADYKLNDIKVILPKLKGGKKYVIAGINFYDGLSRLLPESYSSINSLCKLMKKNKKMKIRIEGHAEEPGQPSLYLLKELSEKRARAIYKILLLNGIEKERVTTIGFGTKYMLFPRKDASLAEQAANRRVEINVLSVSK